MTTQSILPQPQPPRQEIGWIQLGISYEETSLIVNLWSAKGLTLMETSTSVSLPRPFALLRLCIYG